MMRLGINTFLFTSPFTNESTKLFARFKKWGFKSVEIALEDPSHIDAAHVKRELTKAGLVCGSICACMGPDRDLRGTDENQETAKTYLKAIIDKAADLDGAKVIGPVYSAVGRADAVEAADYARQWKTVVKHLKEIARHAQGKGVTIALEPLNRFETDFINTAEQALKMIDDVNSPALRLHLDTFHMNIEEKDLARAIKKAGTHLVHLHACGSDRGTPGGDHTAWPEIVKALKSVKYDGDIVIESFTKDVKIIARAAAIWRKIEPSNEDIAIKGAKFLKKALTL
jgi:D-psicose/D-tagatose/L-ribulose 3-epimerase